VIGTTAAAAVIGARIATDHALPASAMAATAPIHAADEPPAPATVVDASPPPAIADVAESSDAPPRMSMAGYLSPDGMSSLLGSPASAPGAIAASAAPDLAQAQLGPITAATPVMPR
jgi:hypothetical protein